MKKKIYSILFIFSAMILPLLQSCIKPQGGFSEEIVTGPAITDDPGLNVFLVEEPNILQFLTNLEGVANGPDTSYYSKVLDPYIAQCNVDGNTIAKFQEKGDNGTSNNYQTFFTSVGTPNLFGVRLDFDINALRFVSLLELNFATISGPSSPVNKRLIITVPLSINGTPVGDYEMHLTKLSNGKFLWIGNEGGLAAAGTDCL